MQSQAMTASKLFLDSEPVREVVTSSVSQSRDLADMLLLSLCWEAAAELLSGFDVLFRLLLEDDVSC